MLVESGYNLGFQKSKGNPWWGINLEGILLKGQGIDLALEKLELNYFLPALLKGKLPLSLVLKEVEGNFSLEEFINNQSNQNGDDNSKGIKPVLKKLDIEGLKISVNNVPYELPEFDLSNVEILGEERKVRANLATAQGQSSFEADLESIDPLLGTVDFWDTDLSLAQHWYSGIKAGKAAGKLWLKPEGISVEAELTKVSTSIIGIAITEVQGKVNYHDSLLRADVKGQAFGAEIIGDYQANLSEEQWRGEIKGTAQLAEAILWLNNQNWLPFAQSFLNAQGEADVTINLSGWNYLDVKGKAVGKGTLLGKPLDDLIVDINYHTHKGPNVYIAGDVANGDMNLAVETKEDTLFITGDAKDLRWWDADIVTKANMSLQQSYGQLSGEVLANLMSNTLGRKAEVELRATPEEDFWALNVNGVDNLGGGVTATGTLIGEELKAELDIVDFQVAYLNEPLAVSVNANGLYYDLPLELDVSTNRPLSLSFLADVADIGVTGEAKATLKNFQDFVDIEAIFGNFNTKGNLNFSQQLGELSYQLFPIGFNNPFAGEVQGEGVLKFAELWSANANFYSSVITLPELEFANPKAEFNWLQNEPITFQGTADNLSFELIGTDLTANLQDYHLDFADKDLMVVGNLQTSLPTWQETLKFDLKGEAEYAFMNLQGGFDEADVKLNLQNGFEVAAVQLHENTDFNGTVNLGSRSASLIGQTTQNNASVDLELKNEGLYLIAKVNDTLNVQGNGLPSDLVNWPWHFSGGIAPEKILPLFGIAANIKGDLQGQMQVTTLNGSANFDGQASFAGSALGFKVDGDLTGQGESILAQLEGRFLRRDVRLEGQVFPSFDSRIHLGDVTELDLKGNYDELELDGEGFIDLLKATNSRLKGLVIPPQPYLLSSKIKDRYADITVGESQLRLSWQDSWQLSGHIKQAASWQDFNQDIALELDTKVYIGSDLPQGDFSGQLLFDQTPLDLSGSLDNLSLVGNLPTEAYIQALNLPLKIDDQVALTAQLQPLNLSYQIEGIVGVSTLNLSGQGSEAILSLNSYGLAASYDFTRHLQIQADNFALHNYLKAEAVQDAAIIINGDLSYQQDAQQWQGSADIFTEVSGFSTPLKLWGEGSSLLLSANPEINGFETSVNGQIMPEFGLELTTKNNQLELSGQILGELTKPSFQGSLISKELNLASAYLPAQTAQVSASWQDGLLAQISSETANVTLRENTWSGELNIPFLLQGEDHYLTGKLQGDLANPKLIGSVLGNTLNASNLTIDKNSLQSSFQLNSKAFTPLDAQWQGEVSLTGQDWQGYATTTVSYNETPVPARLEARGSLQSGVSLDGTLWLGEEAITLSTQKANSDLNLNANFTNFDLHYLQNFVPIEIAGVASGQITFLWQERCFSLVNLVNCLYADIEASPRGNAWGQAFNFNLDADTQTGFSLQGSVGETLVDARGSSWQSFDLNLGENAGFLGGLGTISASVDAEGLVARATYQNQPLTLLLQGDSEAFTWNVNLAEASFVGTANKQEYGYGWQSTLTGLGFLGFDDARAQGYFQAGNLQLASLEATGLDSNLTLSGSLFPQTLLTGSLNHVSLPETTTLTANKDANSNFIDIVAMQQGMQLQAYLEGSKVKQMQLTGNMNLNSLNIASNLNWYQTKGYTGTAQLNTVLESLALQIDVTGNGELSGLGSIHYQDLSVAKLSLYGTRELMSQLSGNVSLDIPFENVSKDIPAGYARLKGDLALLPIKLVNVANLNLLGDIYLEGTLEAKGNLLASLQGLELRLASEILDLRGDFDHSGWQLQGEIINANITPLIARQWQGLAISEVWGEGYINAQQKWQGNPSLHLSDLMLRSANSYLQGKVTYEPLESYQTITAMPSDEFLAVKGDSNDLVSDLSFAINIADFHPQYSGQLNGTMQLAGLEIVSGFVNTNNLSLTSQNWQASLESTVTGHIPDIINADTKGVIRFLGQEHSFSGPISLIEGSIKGSQHINSPLLETPIGVSGNFWPLEIDISQDNEKLHVSLQDNTFSSSGELATTVYGVPVTISAHSKSWLKLDTQIIGMPLTGYLPQQLSELKMIAQNGIELASDVASISLDQYGASITGLGKTPYVNVSLNGNLQWADGISGSLSGELIPKQEQMTYVPLSPLPFSITVSNNQLNLRSENDLIKAQGQFNLVEHSGNLIANLQLDSANASANLAYQKTTGLFGQIELSDVPLFSLDSPLIVSSQIGVTSSGLQGTGELSFFEGCADLSGEVGWAKLLPRLTQFLPTASNGLSVQLDLNNFALAGIPWLSKHLPYVDALLLGSVYLSDSSIAGQLTTQAKIFEQALPLQVNLSGDLSNVNALVNLDSSSTAELQYKPYQQELVGQVNFEYFPFESLLEAVFGQSNLTAQLTGGARFVVPFKSLQQSEIIFASEQIILEESALSKLRSIGNINARFQAGSLYIEQARFRNMNTETLVDVGNWRASGEISAEKLNFEIRAEEADFSPFLQLLPTFTGLDIAAKGSLAVKSLGNLREPHIVLTIPQLAVDIVGGQYRLSDATFSLSDSQLSGGAILEGFSPLQGNLNLTSQGQLSLLDPRSSNITFNFAGDFAAPIVGQVDMVTGRIYHDEQGWWLSSSGELGETFQLAGKLYPLELNLTGENLLLKAERFFVGQSKANVNLQLLKQSQDYIFSGELFAQETTLVPRPKIPQEAIPDYYSYIKFNDINLSAPRDLRFSENFGSAELTLSLILAGSAATPTLQGEIDLVQGKLRYSGQDFTLLEGKAVFEPSRGVFPQLTARAYSSYDKARLGREVEFLSPKNQYYFDVYIDIEGAWEYSPLEEVYQFELVSDSLDLSSNALVNFDGQARALNKDELASLIAFGRFSFGDNIVSEQGLGTAVGYSALDTAVDLLLVSELQKAISESLGVPSVEISTTAISTLLNPQSANSNSPFGFSVSLGGYLDDNLFASYSLGRYNDPNFALSNTFELRYNLADIFANLRSEINFEDDNFNNPQAKVGLSIDYQFAPTISFQTNFDFSTQEQGAGFGVSFKW